VLEVVANPAFELVIRAKLTCMTMLSFRVPDDDAAEVQRWADVLGVDRSEILRDALHRHLVVLNGEADAETWRRQPPTEAERSLEAIADWGPAEDWSDWRDAAG
jgi:predicted transcriptional regulator